MKTLALAIALAGTALAAPPQDGASYTATVRIDDV
jgi:hypothetical protein